MGKSESHWLSTTILAVISVSGLSASAAEVNRPNLSGVWMADAVQPVLKPAKGEPPLSAQGKKAQSVNALALTTARTRTRERNDMSPCVPLGPTRILSQPFPLQIVEKDDVVVLIFEHNHVYLPVYFHENADPDPNSDWTYNGYAVGKWTKRGMSVELSNFNDLTMLDDAGLPHSERLRVRQEFELAPDGNSISITSTITDPVMYARPWVAAPQTLRRRPELHIEEFVCGQGTLETRYTREAGSQQSPGGQ